MGDSEQSTVKIEAELRTPLATVQIVRFTLTPVDAIDRGTDTYRLNFCQTPRPLTSRAGYPERWGPHRFERVGDIFLVPPGEVLHHRSDRGEQVSVVCEVAASAVEQWLTEPIEWSDRRLEASLDVPSAHIRALLSRLGEEAYRPGLASPAMAELMAAQLAIEISRFCAAISDGPATGGLAAWRLRIIDERLRDLAVPIALDDLARLCNLSVRQLTRGFRASRGCSITEYVARSRIEHAKRLLSADGSIKAIAFTIGFSSPSSFAHAFRQATGTTPREFRQRVSRRNP